MAQVVTLDAKPGPISIDPTRTAVIVVDAERLWLEGGMFDRAGIDTSGIQGAVAPTARVLASARHAGLKIVYLKMGYRPDLSNMGSPDAPNRVQHLEMLGAWVKRSRRQMARGADCRCRTRKEQDPGEEVREVMKAIRYWGARHSP